MRFHFLCVCVSPFELGTPRAATVFVCVSRALIPGVSMGRWMSRGNPSVCPRLFVLFQQVGAGSRVEEDRADAGDLLLVLPGLSRGLEFLGAVSCFLSQIGTQIGIM